MASSKKAGRIVRRRLADGTVKTYTYGPYKQRSAPKRDTLDHLISAWMASPEWSALQPSTQSGYVTYSRPLVRMGHIGADKIERRDIIVIRNALAEASGHGAATAFQRCASALFAWGVENDFLKFNPIARLRRLKGGSLPAWSALEADRAQAELLPHLAHAVLLARYSGQRRGDLVRMLWSDYDGERLRVRQQKTGTALVIPVHPILQRELDQWPRTAVTILTNRFGRPWTSPSNLSKQLQDGLAKLPGFRSGLNVHGLRKLACAALAEAGASPHEIMAISGHKTLALVAHYTRSADQPRLASAAIIRLAGKARS